MKNRFVLMPTSLACSLRTAFGFLMALFFLVGNARAQSGEGTTPTLLTPGVPAGSYALSGFDSVNLHNGNLNFHLPLLNVGGRGSAQSASMLKIETRWRVIQFAGCSPCEPGYYPTYNWWTGHQVGYGPGTMEGRAEIAGTQQDELGGTYPQFSLLRFTFTTPDGTEYELRDALTDGAPQQVIIAQVPPRIRFFNRGSIFVTKDGTSATFVSCTANGTLIPIIDTDSLDDPLYPAGYLLLRDGTRYRIDAGLVTWMQDRNGNRINFFYDIIDPGTAQPDGRVTRIVDSLNRQVTIAYNVNAGAPYGVCDQISFQGFGAATRVIRISHKPMSNALRSGFTIHSTLQLFPGIEGSDSTPFNPSVVSAVWLPDDRSYKFFYNDYGELARLELPTGGATEYDWGAGAENPMPGGVEGGSVINRRVLEKRIYPNGGTGATYEKRSSFGKYLNDIVEVKDYGSGPTALLFSKHYFLGTTGLPPTTPIPFSYNSWREAREFKTESLDTNGDVLQSVEHTIVQQSPSWWNQSAPGYAPVNDPRITETKTTWVQTGQVSKQTYAYDAYLNKTAIEEFDYGIGSPPAKPVRRTETDYVTTNELNGIDYTGSSLQTGINSKAYLRSLPQEHRTYSVNTQGVKTIASSIHFYYDQSPLTDRPSITGHDSVYGTSYIPRGNLTSNVRLLDTGGSVTISQKYDIAGHVVELTDALNNTSLIGFAGSFNTYAFATSMSTPVPDPTGQRGSSNRLVTQYDYDFSSGLVKSITDPNNRTTIAFYNDELDRLTSITAPDGGFVVYTYGDTIGNLFLRTQIKQDAANTLDNYTYFDGLGRSTKAAQTEDSSSIFVETKYDAMGRIAQVSNPYRTGTPVWTTTEYDALNRVFRVTNPGGAQTTSVYSGNTVTVTDPATRMRTTTSDALGRITQVIEDPGSSPHLNYQTTYLYDALDNLRKVTQGGQIRYFLYDSLKRLIRTRNPEHDINSNIAVNDPVTGNGQWSFKYIYDLNGNLSSKVDPRNITCNYTYDSLNRMTGRSYAGDTSQTPSLINKYDGVGATVQNALGHLTSVNATSASGFSSTTTYDNFDVMGRALHTTQNTDNNIYQMSYQYDFAGHLVSETYPSNRVVTTSYDGAGRISDLSSNATHYVSQFTYAPHGAVTDVKLGNNLWEHAIYDTNRLQPTEIGLGNAKGASDKLKLNYSYGTSTTNNGSIKSQTITIPSGPTLIQSYNYDGINRLDSAQENNGAPLVWKQKFTYDQFGNRGIDTNQTTPGFEGANPLISSTTNRIVPRPSEQYLYDLAGNLKKDAAGHNFDYDAENRLVKYDGTVGQYFYDGNEQRVKKVDSTGTTIFVYDAMGKLVAEYTTGPATGSGTSYLTQDVLGSPRIITGTSGTVKARHDYLPYGEEIQPQTGGRTAALGYVTDKVRQKFTGKERDQETGLDFFLSRYYASGQGRFTSTDSVAGKTANPQTFNRYTYVLNNPLALVDPTGHEGVSADQYEGVEEKLRMLEEQKKQERELSAALPPAIIPIMMITVTPEAAATALAVVTAIIADVISKVTVIYGTTDPEKSPGMPVEIQNPHVGNKTPEDLFFFAPIKVRPRENGKGDVTVKDGKVEAQGDKAYPDGKSSFSDVNKAPLTGKYFRVPKGSVLPPGTNVRADGRSPERPNSPHGPSHYTIYPTVNMPFDTFNTLVVNFIEQNAKDGGKKK